MLSERVKKLLTAAVDGELDYLESRALQRLLRESDEARNFYHDLKRNALRLRDLPQSSLPPHFSCEVLHAIGQVQPAAPSTLDRAASRASRYLPVWANIAAAAAVLLAICAGTYLIIVLGDQEKVRQNLVERNPAPELIPAPIPSPGPAAPYRPVDPVGPEAITVLPNELIEAPKAVVVKTTPDSPPPLTRSFVPQQIQPILVEPLRLPGPFALRDIDQQRSQLLDVMKKEDTLHVDLFCRDANKALERVQAVTRGQGIRSFVDVVAQDRLTRKLKTSYALYFDALTPDEAIKLLQTLSAEDRKAEAKHDQQFEKLVTSRFSPDSYKQLTALLGIEPKWLREKSKSVPTDPLKAVTDDTAEKLATKLGERPGTRMADHHVLIVSAEPARPNPMLSKEIQQFLLARKDRKAGSISIFLVLK